MNFTEWCGPSHYLQWQMKVFGGTPPGGHWASWVKRRIPGPADAKKQGFVEHVGSAAGRQNHGPGKWVKNHNDDPVKRSRKI